MKHYCAKEKKRIKTEDLPCIGGEKCPMKQCKIEMAYKSRIKEACLNQDISILDVDQNHIPTVLTSTSEEK